ncbi:MAG: polyprenyl synthetase family protein [Armatimonadota bacterium]|nr:polyprenyl synthetase family protein [Armatimonadota bacterium]
MTQADAHLRHLRQRVQAAIEEVLPQESERPSTLHRAMRYPFTAGGKRTRAVLCLLCAEVAASTATTMGETRAADGALLPAVAVELLHTHSLMHDDLPAMDDSPVRRGAPAAHVVFGEATTMLAADALLVLAFELLARCPASPPHPPGQLVWELASAAGSRGLAGGQFEDLAKDAPHHPEETLHFVHRAKSASLMRAAARMGGIAAGAPVWMVDALGRYGEALGLAFQMVDDILDALGTLAVTGKPAHQDFVKGRPNAVLLYGLEEARARSAALTARAVEALQHVPGDTRLLEFFAETLLNRKG